MHKTKKRLSIFLRNAYKYVTTKLRASAQAQKQSVITSI